MGAEAQQGSSIGRKQPLTGKIFAAAIHILIGMLAVAGIVAIVEAPIFASKTDAVTPADWPTILERADLYVKYGAIALAAYTALCAIGKLETIVRAFRGYQEARAPIYELAGSLAGIRTMLDSLKETMSTVQQTSLELSQQATKIKELQAAIEKTDQAVKDAVDQLADMERLAAVGETSTASGEEDDGAQDPATDAWEELRALWNTNARRLDTVRSNIGDRRTRARFMRMPRKNYKKIIDSLAAERYISETARKSSLRLHRLFMSARRSKAVSAQDIGDVRLLDQALEHDFETYQRPAEILTAPTRPSVANNNTDALA